MSLEALAALSRDVGRRVPLWVQGSGGNVSWKDHAVLHVKASGTRLGDVSTAAGLARLDLTRFVADLAAAGIAARTRAGSPTPAAELAYSAALTAATLGEARPSMEAILHALLPAPFVVHLHSLPALLMAHQHRQSPDAFGRWLPRAWKGRLAVLPAVRPGLELGWELIRHRHAAAVILQNHGVVLQLPRPDAGAAWVELERAFCARHGYRRLGALLDAGPGASGAAAAAAAAPAAMPLRFYFPDTAVFYAKLAPRLEARGEGLVFAGGDRDLSEIWLAQRLLYAEEPELSGLPESIIGSVASLPVEQLRIARHAG